MSNILVYFGGEKFMNMKEDPNFVLNNLTKKVENR